MKRMDLNENNKEGLGVSWSGSPVVITANDVKKLPKLDVLLGFAKPSLIAAGLRCCDSRVELYHSLDGSLCKCYVEHDTCAYPSQAVIALLGKLGIERGENGDGPDMEGKIVDLTERSMAVPIGEVYPHLTVVTESTLFDFDEVINFVRDYYPGDMWVK